MKQPPAAMAVKLHMVRRNLQQKDLVELAVSFVPMRPMYQQKRFFA